MCVFPSASGLMRPGEFKDLQNRPLSVIMMAAQLKLLSSWPLVRLSLGSNVCAITGGAGTRGSQPVSSCLPVVAVAAVSDGLNVGARVQV